ncbi:MAG: ABC transporter substrate-binding protein [Anaeromyxobacter sp.]|nr:ABC transporter substrate-binding protein [Anaeromyxobacter sp.]MBL0277944.1 ABC transporter substrate-binding protein [Anaeromyxobacter sp.]
MALPVLLLVAVLGGAPPHPGGAKLDPAATVREGATRFRAALEGGADREALAALVAGYVDHQAVARRSVGPAWKRLGAADRAALVAAVRALLEETYLGRLDPAGQATFLVQQASASGAAATVRAVAAQGEQVVPLELRLTRGQDGRWRLHDAVVAGVAVVEGWQEQFPQLLALGGVPRLLAQLEAERAALVAKRRPPAARTPQPPR